MKIISLILLILISFNFSCKNKEKVNSSHQKDNILEVSLYSVIDDEFQFKDIYFTDFPVYTQKKGFPRIYANNLRKMRNFPEVDSFLVVSSDLQSASRNYYRYINGYMPLEAYKKVHGSELRKDTMAIRKNKGIKYQMNAVSAFLGNNQIIIPDLNNNNDFGDDLSLVFPKNFDVNNSSKSVDTLPILDFYYQLLSNGIIYDVTRKVQIFPKANHRHSYLMENDLDKLLNNYTLMLRLKDYKKGKISKDGIDYVFAIQGKNELSSIIIKPDSLKYASGNLFMHKFFEYAISDTVQLGKKWYKIKEVAPDYSGLSLELSNKEPVTIDKALGLNHPVLDLVLTGIDGQEVSLFQKMNKKKHIFLDFWGTWCEPCKKLTPNIVDLHKKYKNKVEFVGVALDDNVLDVKDYVTKNNMNWYQAFVNKKNRKNTIVDKWNITSFPTFIVLDNMGKIIYGGHSDSLNEIEKILENLN